MSTPVDFTRIERAIRFLKENTSRQPSLEETAAFVNLSPYHFQRMFTQWAGISPKKFLQYLTLEQLKLQLNQNKTIEVASELSGLSSSSRVYDLFVKLNAVTPGEYQKMGKGIKMEYGFHNTPFGECLLALTQRGICSLRFIDNQLNARTILKQEWPGAILTENTKKTGAEIDKIFSPHSSSAINLWVKGTSFQVKVWEALLQIPFGSIQSYSQVSQKINSRATRAVGSAIGANPVAYLIPCHRVIRSEGIIGQYRWGSYRKTAMIGWEKSRTGTEVGEP